MDSIELQALFVALTTCVNRRCSRRAGEQESCREGLWGCLQVGIGLQQAVARSRSPVRCRGTPVGTPLETTISAGSVERALPASSPDTSRLPGCLCRPRRHVLLCASAGCALAGLGPRPVQGCPPCCLCCHPPPQSPTRCRPQLRTWRRRCCACRRQRRWRIEAPCRAGWMGATRRRRLSGSSRRRGALGEPAAVLAGRTRLSSR